MAEKICGRCGLGFEVGRGGAKWCTPCRTVCCEWCGGAQVVTPQRTASFRFCSADCRVAWHEAHVEERFWSNVDTSGECWVWTRPLHKARPADPVGYGIFCIGAVRHKAHRIAYRLTYGSFPDELHVLHKCDWPPCVRPDHLFLGTNADNQADKKAKGRHPTGADAVFNKYPELRHTGEKNRHAVLTEADVRAIRTSYASGGTTHQKLADQYGTTKSNIGHIVTRKSWRHI